MKEAQRGGQFGRPVSLTFASEIRMTLLVVDLGRVHGHDVEVALGAGVDDI